PAPRAAPADILVTGVGGTGVITVGALLGMAAHLEGLAATVLDNTGLARKGGAVATHVRIGGGHAVHHTPRIGEGGADIVLGCDLVVTAGPEVLPRIGRGRCRVLLNDHANPTAAQLADPDAPFDRDGLRRTIVDVAGPDRVESLDATTLALSLLGDAIYANVLLLGMAAQRGLLPVSVAALEKAIALNETNAEENRAAFNWGRRLAADPNCAPTSPAEETEVPLDKAIARRAAYLAIYQDTAYAERYGALVARVAAAEAKIGGEAFTRAAAGSYFKLLAIKDEYEVARLLSDPEFHANLARDFEGDYRVAYHLAPPLLASADPTTGEPVKRRYGPWLRGVLRLVAGLKGLRGTAFDIFGRTEERKRERAMILAFEAAIDRLLKRLDKSNRDEAASIVALHERIRGFGPVKERAMSKIEAEVAARLARYEAPVTMAAG
ncbi:MAG: indolepyruvate ferredoxin oxidoreductase family protein, partial [Alphaproteobacteria bacterium]|nr:indolepyruvate ferredoxin oxidoreductase family protein [Alphaproteobacteria bacterium]